MIVKFTSRNFVNLIALVAAEFAATLAHLAISSVVIVGILAMAGMKVFWVALDNVCEIRTGRRGAHADQEVAMDYLLRRREQIAEHAREMAGR